mmetsp:Transcript_620/g.867  ORF Transcript_620/g.867 Transcript_620/m.867 type:complete len:140 (-) Transcript_620:2304-2723(-)
MFKASLIIPIFSYLAFMASAFAPNQSSITCFGTTNQLNVSTLQKKSLMVEKLPSAITNSRKSVANVQTMGLFGLGGPEIVIILIAAAFLLGPQKLAELGGEAGKMASDLKDVPKEFQKGMEEGEIEAKSRKAKQMEDIE